MRNFDLSGFTMMVVDSNTETTSLLSAMLKALGVGSVKTFAKGTEATRFLTQVSDNPDQAGVMSVDCVIAVWQPDMDEGPDLLHSLRNHPDPINRFIPLIAVLGAGQKEQDVDPRQVGADEVLESPFTVKSLSAALVRLIAAPRQYVQTPAYFGPDRRLQKRAYQGQDRRLLNDKSAGVKVIYG